MSIALVDEIINALNNATEVRPTVPFTFEFLAENAFDQTNDVFPRVIIRQTANRPKHMVSAENQWENEATTTIGYQIEIYSRDYASNGLNLQDRVAVGGLMVEELQQWFWNEYGLQRNTWSPSSSVDDATIRSVFRVNGVLDRYGYIYRS